MYMYDTYMYEKNTAVHRVSLILILCHINPSNAGDTFILRAKVQTFLKNI